MRQTISSVIAAVAVMTVSAAPAMACGGFGLFQSSCSPCGQQAYVDPCEQAYVAAPVYSGCDTGCGGYAYARLADPEQQYYYANQGPTYSGPGAYAPYPTYQEGTVSGWSGYGYRRHHYGYGVGRGYGIGRGYGVGIGRGYGVGIGRGYGVGIGRGYGMRYGAGMGMSRGYGQGRMMRRY